MSIKDGIYIIAEAGVNHNGDPDLAIRLVESAAAAGADAVKFQTFKAQKLVRRDAEKAEYQKQATGSAEGQYEMLKRLELDYGMHRTLQARCEELGIDFLSTPFDEESAKFLRDLGLRLLKVPSGEITNLPYLRLVGGLGINVVLSTGMSDMDEVRAAIGTLEAAGTPRKHIVVLHCNTQYPTPLEDVHLRAMCAMGDELGVAVGYSDHTLGIEVPIAAAALGATVVEKHFTLDRTMEGPDHAASLEPEELAAMVRGIRGVEKALGDPIKQPSPSEADNRSLVRRSIVAARPIAAGAIIVEDDLRVKRPGTGLSPMRWDEVVGSRAVRRFVEDEALELEEKLVGKGYTNA